jgi:signal recognition particle subunit SRP54
MFENLTDRLSQTLRHVTGKAKLTEDNIKDTLREVRMALLEADVALPVVKDFVNSVKERAVGTEVSRSLTPGQAFVKIVQAELESLMGAANEDLNLSAVPPAVILMAGLQGAGKTTTAGKLARFLKERKKKSVMVVSADIYRPAAIKQLETLANDIGVTFFPSDLSQKPVDIANAAIKEAKLKFIDVVIVDTAARRDQPGRNPVRGRRHDRSGRRQHGQGLRRCAAADRCDPHQGRRRRPWRCRAVGARHHRQADQVHRYGREERSARSVPP